MAEKTAVRRRVMSKDFFNARAAIWDEQVTEKDAGKLKAMADRLDIKLGETVLDVGTGTGVFVPFLLEKIGRKGKLVCLDYAGEMLKIAKAKGFKGNITFLCADITESRLAGESFDSVVCYSVFPHFEDKPGILREIYRLLKKGGRLFVCHTSSRQAINDIHRGLAEVNDHLIPENDDMYLMLAGARFKDIRIEDGKEDYLAAAVK
jgi:ubiquinone/menaquinone biosynthesis C-methylase UbiE